MKKGIHLLAILTFLLSFSCSPPSLEEELDFFGLEQTANEQNSAQEISPLATEVFSLINSYRSDLNLADLKWSELAYGLALNHNEHMVETESLNHDNFNWRKSKISLQENASDVAENISRHFVDSQEVLEAWLMNQIHRQHIEGDFNNSAVAVSTDGKGQYYLTQIYFKK
tara:strand:+ start:1858 stop:2367 length:510 start_codon:yes stop_codon:yes gene_type:complete